MSSSHDSTTRRDFLKVAGGAAAGVLVTGLSGKASVAAAEKTAGAVPVPKAEPAKFSGGKLPKGPVMATGRAIGANDRINVGFVGTGGQGHVHVRNFTDKHVKENNIQPVAVCDVYLPRLERNRAYITEKGGVSSVQAEKDYRRLLENKDIDAIVISTPEHWHAQIAVHAMEAGKHVYIEKPMTRYLDEAFQILDAAKRTGRVVQIGSQRCNDHRYHAAGEAIRSGKIGPLVSGQGSYTRNAGTKGEWNYAIDADAGPNNLDWEMWLGSAPKRPWKADGSGAAQGEQRERDDSKTRFFRYRKYWDYSAGILGDLMPHTLHPFLIASGNPEYPVRVTSTGTRRISTDREVDDTVQVLAEFPSGWTMLWIGSTVNEQGLPDLIRGHKGTIYFPGGGGGLEMRPERPYAEEIEASLPATEGPGESVPGHEADWLLAIRTGKKPNCDIDLATKVQTIISLAEMSARTDKTILFDEKTRKVTAG